MKTTQQAGFARASVCALVLLVALATAGCERAAPEPVGTLTPPSGTAVAATAAPTRGGTTVGQSQSTAVASAPATAATRAATLVVAPSATPSRPPVQATATSIPPTPTPTRPITGPTMQVKVYMVAEGDDGKLGPKIGCGDSIVPVERTVARTTAVLTAAEKELVSIKSRTIGDPSRYNALFASNLTVDFVQLVGTKATVRLKGQVLLGGICDTPRVIAQIRYTALQFSTVKDVAILLNNVPIEQALSQR